MVERVIQGRGFVTIPETLNAVDAWLSSIPGNAYANVRQPIVSTLNLAHMMPLSAVWAGPEKNDHLDGPPLIVTRTDGATPFRLVTHIGDVGHAGRWPHRHGQVGTAGDAGLAVPPLLRLADLRLRHGPLHARHHPRPGRRALRPGRRWRHRVPAARPHRPRGLSHLGSGMGRRPLVARRHRHRPRREGGHLVGARQPRRCAAGTAHDDWAFRAAAIERAAAGARPTCSAAPTASCWTQTPTALAPVPCRASRWKN